MVCGIGGPQLGSLQAAFGQQRQEEYHTYQCVASVMQFGIDHPTVALAADHGGDLFHFGYYVYFADCRRCIFATVLLGYVPQGA